MEELQIVPESHAPLYEPRYYCLQCAIATSSTELRPNPCLRPVTIGYIPPLATGVGDIEKRVNDLTQVLAVLATPLAWAFQMGFESRPLGACHVCWVSHALYSA